MLIGAHVSPAGGPAKAVERGEALGADAIQIFNQNPRAWKPTTYSEEQLAAYHEAMDGSRVQALMIHAVYLLNKHGIERYDVRVRWWDEDASTYRKAAIVPEQHRDGIPDIPLPADVSLGVASDIPTFLGHYWLTGVPRIQNRKTAVLDYSAAKSGPLVAYRWSGEPELHNEGFVAIGGH